MNFNVSIRTLFMDVSDVIILLSQYCFVKRMTKNLLINGWKFMLYNYCSIF